MILSAASWCVILAYLSLFAYGLGDNIRGPLYPEILRAYELSNTAGSWVFGLSSLAGVLGSLASHAFFRRWDRVRTLNFSLVVMAFSLAGMGLAPDFFWMLAACAGFGFSMGLISVCQNALASVGAPEHRRRQILGGLHSMYGLASLLAPMLVAVLVPWTGSWRSPFLMAAAVTALLAVWTLWKLPREPEETLHKGSHRSARGGPPPRRAEQLWVSVILSCYVVAEILIGTRLALYLRRESGADLESSSLAVTMFFVGLLAGRLLMAVLPGTGSLRRILAGSLIGSISLLILGLQGWTWGLILSGLAMAPFYPVVVAFIAQQIPRHIDSTMSWALTLQSFMVVVMHVLVGWLTDEHGIHAALWTGPAVLAVSLIFLVSYGPLFHRRSTGI
ncbi:MAG: MFS transporter [Bdellovibrionaceae bacterium]|nr:MFS transporter [Pseudobdellovibrionaceae bacterium]MBX3033357.1 MFS transporter [Pseudobdellovibrionaceae bacterium]